MVMLIHLHALQVETATGLPLPVTSMLATITFPMILPNYLTKTGQWRAFVLDAP